MSKKIILLNGPAGCGKDTGSDLLKEIYQESLFQYKMALPLKEACHKLLGLEGSLEALEHLKERPIKFLVNKNYNNFISPVKLVNNAGEMTLRQFYIHVSENLMKPMFGIEIFGKLAVENIKNNKCKIVTISDSGFEDEARPIVREFGSDNVVLVKIFRDGKTFAGDSRGYIDLPVTTFELSNNGSLEQLKQNLQSIIENS